MMGGRGWNGAFSSDGDCRERTGVENELSRVVDVLPGLIWTALPDGTVDFVNQGWCAYTGMTPDAACGRGWLASIHPDDLPALLERWQAILASGEARDMAARLRRFDGAYRRFVLRVRPLADASGLRGSARLAVASAGCAAACGGRIGAYALRMRCCTWSISQRPLSTCT